MKSKDAIMMNACLIAGAIAFLFSDGAHNIFITAWIWPAAFLYYCRRASGRKQLAMLAAVIIVCQIIKWPNILAAGYPAGALFCLIWSICWILPLLADRLIAPKIRSGFMRSLVFPSVFVTIGFLTSFSPTGSTGLIAYTQDGILPLIQIVSIIGSWGLSFLIIWFGSVAAAAALKEPELKKTAAVYLAVMICVFGSGIARISSFSIAPGDMIKVASVISPFYGKAEDGEYTKLSYEESERFFLSEAERAAAGGADIACWNEESFAIKDSEEEAFIGAAKESASSHGMVLIIGYETEDTDGSEDGLGINKTAIVFPDGTVNDYVKTKLVPLMETSEYLKGSGGIPVVPTDRGVISDIICFDDCFAAYVRSAGQDTDILFVPSWDWKAVKDSHARLSGFRAVENGESLVRTVYDGISRAADPLGREITSSDTDDTGFDTVLFADVPVCGVNTFYSRHGAAVDMIICLPGLIFSVCGLLRKRKQWT